MQSELVGQDTRYPHIECYLSSNSREIVSIQISSSGRGAVWWAELTSPCWLMITVHGGVAEVAVVVGVSEVVVGSVGVISVTSGSLSASSPRAW